MFNTIGGDLIATLIVRLSVSALSLPKGHADLKVERQTDLSQI
jgi:hypothetical protein